MSVGRSVPAKIHSLLIIGVTAAFVCALLASACNRERSSPAAPKAPVVADLLFMPLDQTTSGVFTHSYEIRHYPRAVIGSLVSAVVPFSERDSFSVDYTACSTLFAQPRPLTRDVIVSFGRMLNVKYVVYPIVVGKKGEAPTAIITVTDVSKGKEITSTTVRWKSNELTAPRESQQLLFEASYQAADALIRVLGGKETAPRKGTASLPDTESLFEHWDLNSARKALDRADEAIRREPNEARTWAIAARAYAQLAHDTAKQPARFHRECRVRALAAADIARHLAPDDPDVRLASALAYLENHVPVEAEAAVQVLPARGRPREMARMVAASVRRNPVLIPELPDRPTSGTDALQYYAAETQAVCGRAATGLDTLTQLLENDRSNVALAVRYAQMREYASHPNNHLDAGLYAAVLGITQAMSELIPEIWKSSEAGRQLAGHAKSELSNALGEWLPVTLDTPEEVATFRHSLDLFSDRSRGQAALVRARGMAPANTLFRLLTAYSHFDQAVLDWQVNFVTVQARPAALSVLDRVRLYDRMIVAALGEIRIALDSLALAEEGDRFAEAAAAAFPRDEAAQASIGMHHFRGPIFRPPVVTQHFNQAFYAWRDYTPTRKIYGLWATAEDPPSKAVSRYEDVVVCDILNGELATEVAQSLYDLRQLKSAAEIAELALKRNPWQLDARALQLHIERARTGKQIERSAIDAIAREFDEQAAAHTAIADLYWNAGYAEEAETAYRRVLEGHPGHITAFFQLIHVLRLQGRVEESESLIGPFVNAHHDLNGNRAVREAIDYRLDRREYDQAASLSQQYASALDPSERNAICTMGRLRWFRGDEKGARAEFERYYSRYVGCLGACRLSHYEALRGNWEEMYRQGQRLVAARPTTTDAYMLLALYHMHKGELNYAEAAVATSCQILAHSPVPYHHYARYCYYRGDYAEAIRHCLTSRRYSAIQYYEDYEELEFQARLAVGQIDEATSVLARLQLFAPNSTLPRHCETRLHLRNGNTSAAAEAIAAARRYNPNNTDTQVLYARVLLAQGDREAAIAELQQAIDNAHHVLGLTDALCALAEAFDQSKRPEDAEKVRARLRELWPHWGNPPKKKTPSPSMAERPGG